MNEKHDKKWEKIRSKGKFRFVLVYGILLLGLMPGAVAFMSSEVFDYFFDYQAFQTRSENFTLKFILWLIFWSLVGLFNGFWMWNYREKEFSKTK